MRLLSLKLLTKFRGLAAGSEFRFDGTQQTEGKIEPICLVGLNGSGKSNLLEVVSEVFFYLDDYVLKEGKPQKKFKSPFGFDITYSLDMSFELARNNKLEKIGKLSWEGTRNATIRIVKEKDKLPLMTLSSNKQTQIENSSDPDVFILPNHIIAYSSGQNELISNPYIKSSYRYFDLIEKRQAKDINLELGLNRLVFLDYEMSQIATVCNFLFAEQNNIEILIKELELDDDKPLDSFSMTIRYRNYKNNKITFPRSVENAITNLKACATCIDEIKEDDENGETIELKLAFWYNKELRTAFQRKFGSVFGLYRDLYCLSLLNIHLHAVETRKRIREAPSGTYDNLSDLVPVPVKKKLLFVLDKLRFKKKNQEDLIKYKNLSDGEHQLMHVLGSIMLLNTSGSVLLYDEPETHFNPEWRSQLITLINKAAIEKDVVNKIRKQEIIISSHSPFIVSDCQKDRVFIFEKGEPSHNPRINTFGASVNIITEEVFKKKESISGLSMWEIEKIKAMPLNTPYQVQQAKEAARILGDSVEKVLLFRELITTDKNFEEE